MKEKESFMDKNTLITVVLVFVMWFCWDSYMRKKYPAKNKVPLVSQEKGENETEENRSEVEEKNEGKRLSVPVQKSVKREEKLFAFESEKLSFQISSRGMGFKNLNLNQISDREGKSIWLFSGDENLPFETRLAPQAPLFFEIEKNSERSWKGRALWNEVEVVKTLTIDPELFLIQTEIQIKGNLTNVSNVYTVMNQREEEKKEQGGFSALFVPPDFLSFFVSSAQGFEQLPIDKEKSPSQDIFSSVKAVAIGSKYFGQAWMENKSDVLPQFIFDNSQLGFLHHSVLNPKRDFHISYKVFIGPKDFSLLKKEYPSLVRVDFGWFGFLSRFILEVLQLFYALVGNWGFSIILLTVLVRLVLLPFILSSHRSMEVMQAVQPEIKKVREKFKKDPQRMNQEIMALMKTHRANPLGGCLPLLLQIPVFWSLWKALSNSYSLYRSPFVFWVQDLSWKDPYYVLPVFMGVFMFIQQKISPVNMSKEMVRAMQIMPVFMVLFMINLPSGLVLYMLVSTLFGLVQQVYLNKKKKGLTKVITEKETKK